MKPSIHDVLILGGGPAGLAAATALARQLWTAIVFDSGVYRNARTKHMHNVPTWDHRDPEEFRSKARADLRARYETVQFEKTEITSLRRTPNGLFQASDDQGRVWNGRKVVLATGVQDIYPPIQGFDDVWAHGVYHCLFCDGYEDRGAPSVGVLAIEDLANPAMAIHMAHMAKRLGSNVNIYTDGSTDLSKEIEATVGDPDVRVQHRRITRFERGSGGSGVVVHLDDDTQVVEGFLAYKPRTQLNGPFAGQLGLELTELGFLKVTPPFNETSVKGVFAAGDCASPMPAVLNALTMGAFAAVGTTTQLHVEPVADEAGADVGGSG